MHTIGLTGNIAAGKSAVTERLRAHGLTVIDADAAWSVDPAAGRSKSRNTPFAGRALRGRAVHVFVDGDHRLGAA